MLTQLLILIYLSFISLGLPDSLLGSAWPAMRVSLSAPVSYAGIVSMIVSCGTIVSSMMSARLLRRFGTGLLTAVSVGLTAAALAGFAASRSFWLLCVLAVPLGLGAGAVDAGLNNFVALHYAARHMNWLHCFWGIGATCGPLILSLWLARGGQWRMGYGTVAAVQAALFVLLLVTLPLWKRAGGREAPGKERSAEVVSLGRLLRLPNAKLVLAAFFCYCAVEQTIGLWGGSYAVEKYGVTADTAARWTSVYYFGITFGRFVSGFASLRLSERQLIRAGQGCVLAGAVLLLLPLPVWKLPVGLCVAGLGCAPIYPNMLQDTPKIFGKSVSQSIMGIQMAFAYVGSTFMPALFGWIAQYAGIAAFPVYLLAFILPMALCRERVNRGAARGASAG